MCKVSPKSLTTINSLLNGILLFLTNRILISHGAIINEANRYGDTALIIASARGDVTGVKILMEAGADPSIHNKEGRTAADCSKMNWSRKTADIMSILQKTFDAA